MIETCFGCTHPLDYHVKNVIGNVVCVCTTFNPMKNSDTSCDCINYISQKADLTRERTRKAEAERIRRMNELIDDLKNSGKMEFFEQRRVHD